MPADRITCDEALRLARAELDDEPSAWAVTGDRGDEIFFYEEDAQNRVADLCDDGDQSHEVVELTHRARELAKFVVALMSDTPSTCKENAANLVSSYMRNVGGATKAGAARWARGIAAELLRAADDAEAGK